MNYKERYKSLKEELSKMEDKTSNLALLLTDSMHDLEKLHPELKESEDERIKKFLIQMAQNGHGKDKDWWNKCAAWLEKQGERVTLTDEQLKVLNEVLNFAANHESPYWNDYIFGTLNNLIRQLKKLNT